MNIKLKIFSIIALLLAGMLYAFAQQNQGNDPYYEDDENGIIFHFTVAEGNKATITKIEIHGNPQATEIDVPNTVFNEGEQDEGEQDETLYTVTELGTHTDYAAAPEKGAFQGLTNITKVTLPYTLEKIGESAFSGCTELQEVSIRTTAQGQTQLTPVLDTISKYAFADCTNLVKVGIENGNDFILPASVEKIEENAFEYCSNLKTSDLLANCNSLVTIGDNCFVGTGFESINLPSNINTIPDGAFKNCTSLKTIPLNEVTIISANAFSGCKVLSITIPEKITEIGKSAFDDVKEIFFEHDEATSVNGLTLGEPGYPPFGKQTDLRIYIPLNTYNLYFSGTNPKLGTNQENKTWEYAKTFTANKGYKLELSSNLPTRIDELTIEMDETTSDYITKSDKDFVVWDSITIKRTIGNDKYYYMTMPFDIYSGSGAITWGNVYTDGSCFKVLKSDRTDVTADYKDKESDIPTTESSEENYPSYYIYRFSSALLAEGKSNDDAFTYFEKGRTFFQGNAYAIGVDDKYNNDKLTFVFSKKLSENGHFFPYNQLTVSVTPTENEKPIAHKWATNFNNWIMLANPFFSPITFGYSDENGDHATAISGSGIRYAYAISTNTQYNPEAEIAEGAQKAYILTGKDFQNHGNDVIVNPHDPIYVQYVRGKFSDNNQININYVPANTETPAQQIPAAAPRHSKILDIALIANGEQLDHTEIKDNPLGADEYVIGEDFYKMFNSGLDEIYTMIGDSVECFANELNLQTSNRIIPLAFHI